MNELPFRVSTPPLEGNYEAAKWLKWPVLADEEEFAELFHRLAPFDLVPLTGVIAPDRLLIDPAFFLSEAKRWIERLRQNEAPTMEELRSVLACAITNDRSCIWLHEVKPERYLVKIKKPVVQIQAHFFSYSQQDNAFHSMVLGKESIFWGVQFSYPQIFLDSEYRKVDETFSNTKLFGQIRQWTRDATRPASFLIDGKKVNVPMRIGKNCLSWIESHPQLKERGLCYAS